MNLKAGGISRKLGSDLELYINFHDHTIALVLQSNGLALLAPSQDGVQVGNSLNRCSGQAQDFVPALQPSPGGGVAAQ